MALRQALLAVIVAAAVSCSQKPEPARAAYDRYRNPDALVAALAIEPGARVADVGAGTGYLTIRLAAAAGPRGRVVATDIDAAALATLDAGARDAGVTVTTRVVRPDEPALERAGYDRILLSEVDQLLPDRAAYFRKLADALAPRGGLAVANRLPFRDAVRAAAAQAGLREAPPPGPAAVLPAQFLLFFRKE